MKRWGIAVVFLTLVLALSGQQAFAIWPFSSAAKAKHERVALIIGNSAYQHTDWLRNPRNDAEDMAALLKTYGFHVVLKHDLTAQQFDETLADFEATARGAEVALFYYAGHGVQYDGNSYLMPVDAKLNTLYAIPRETVLRPARWCAHWSGRRKCRW